MKFWTALGLLCFLTSSLELVAQEASGLLNSAVYEEEVNGDLSAAISLYEHVVSNFPDQRSIAAEALLRLGIVNEKLGQLAAQKYYERLINEYQDQSDYVRVARSRLTRLKSSTPVVGIASNTPAPNQMMRTNTIYYRGGAIRSVSPDGKYFAFADSQKGNLCLYDRSNDTIVKLTPDSLFVSMTGNLYGIRGTLNSASRPIWSPNGSRIAYLWSNQEAGQDLRIVDLTTQDVISICPSDSSRTLYPLDWFRDESRILCHIRVKGSSLLVLIDIETCGLDTVKVFETMQGASLGASVSPDSKYILYHERSETGHTSVSLTSVDGAFDTQLFSNPMFSESDPKWLNDQSGFLYFSDRSRTQALWKATFDKGLTIGDSKLLVDGLGSQRHSIGMTNDDVYYYQSFVSMSEIYAASVDISSREIGPDSVIVSQNPGSRQHPVLSPDGKKLACHLGFSDLEVTDMISGEAQILDVKLSDGDLFSVGPIRWTSDGEHLILIARDRRPPSFTGFNIIRIDVTSGDHTILVKDGEYPALSPDGKTIYFHRDGHIYAKDLGAGMEKSIYSSEDHIFLPSASPDGKYLAFYLGPSERVFFYDRFMLMTLEDRRVRELWRTSDQERFLEIINWLNNSHQVILTTGSVGQTDAQPYLFDINTGQKEELGERTVTDDRRKFFFTLSPDENKIYFHRREGTVHLWSIENY